jgi:hypothetical protein
MLDENGDESRLRPSIQSYKSSFYDRRDRHTAMRRTARRGRWMRLNGLGVAGRAKSEEESAWRGALRMKIYWIDSPRIAHVHLLT